MSDRNNNDWWRGAIIYQIYPRSFMDSNGDGVGDLPGITQKLDYVASLNVDAIWISPFFTSPMADFGYDIADYRDVDRLFGTLADFQRLLRRAHELGLKVIIDQVLSHSSDQHPWFIESSSSRDNPKADWYVWADAKEDGSPPNNWLAFFGGSAWQWSATRQQYYLHNFLVSQPDINFHCAEARQAQLENLKYWLDMGVDGVRLDVVNFYFHSATLQDNPQLAGVKKIGVSEHNPYAQLLHLYDHTQPENIDFLRELRRLLDQYPATTSIGEISAEEPLQVMAGYTQGRDKLHMAYTFDLLGCDAHADHIHSVISRFESQAGDGWACWALSNHDVERAVSRWLGARTYTPQFAKLIGAMLFSLRGSACLYQGEELALPEAELALEDIVDPYGKSFWPDYKGRDGCRTPMVWTNTPWGGFSNHKPWLPIDERHLTLAVSEQEEMDDSVLSFYRRFLKWRQNQPALRYGEIELLPPQGECLGWIRRHGENQMMVIFNLSDRNVSFATDTQALSKIEGLGFVAQVDAHGIELGPFQACFCIYKTLN